MEKINDLMNQILDKYKTSKARIARDLDIPAQTLDGWLNGRIRCRHERMLGLALARLYDKLDDFKREF